MNRRGFLKSMLVAGVAPYVVTTAGVLMPVKKIAIPTNEEILFTQRGTRAYDRRGIISVKDFGAVGDGITDDSAAFNAAVEYASTFSKAVYIPAGIYVAGITQPTAPGRWLGQDWRVRG